MPRFSNPFSAAASTYEPPEPAWELAPDRVALEEQQRDPVDRQPEAPFSAAHLHPHSCSGSASAEPAPRRSSLGLLFSTPPEPGPSTFTWDRPASRPPSLCGSTSSPDELGTRRPSVADSIFSAESLASSYTDRSLSGYPCPTKASSSSPPPPSFESGPPVQPLVFKEPRPDSGAASSSEQPPPLRRPSNDLPLPPIDDSDMLASPLWLGKPLRSPAMDDTPRPSAAAAARACDGQDHLERLRMLALSDSNKKKARSQMDMLERCAPFGLRPTRSFCLCWRTQGLTRRLCFMCRTCWSLEKRNSALSRQVAALQQEVVRLRTMHGPSSHQCACPLDPEPMQKTVVGPGWFTAEEVQEDDGDGDEAAISLRTRWF